MTSFTFDIIFATDCKKGISKENKIPWKFQSDYNFFQSKILGFNDTPVSKCSILICGWKTFQQLKKNYANFFYIIVSSSLRKIPGDTGTFICKSFLEAINRANQLYSNSEISSLHTWVIGGKKIYEEALVHSKLNTVYWTEIPFDYQCDNHINEKILIDNVYFDTTRPYLVFHDTDPNYQVKAVLKVWTGTKKKETTITKVRINSFEDQYIHLLSTLMFNDDIPLTQTRNSRTKSIFGENVFSYNVSLENFPILSSKKMYWKGIVEELLFFLRGETNSKQLEERNIYIWRANTTKDFLTKNNKGHLNEGEIGPMYGYQWRNFNGSGSFDQIKRLVKGLRMNPTSRRHLMTVYNPLQSDQGVLYPCHSIVNQFSFDTKETNTLHMACYQRSADVFLGLPFNLSSNALLLFLICELVGENCTPGKISLYLGDVHLYESHFDAAKIQLQRFEEYEGPYIPVKLEMKKSIHIDTLDEDLKSLSYNDFILHNYNSLPSIHAPMEA